MMNNYQSQIEIIRLLKSQLVSYQIKSVTSLSIGIISLIATPLIGNGYSLRDKIINATGFILGLSSLSYCLIINPKLRQLEGKIKMINELEKSLFIDEQLSIYNQFRQPQNLILQPTNLTTIPTEVTEVTKLQNPQNNELPTVTEVTEDVTVTPVTPVTPAIIDNVISAIFEGKNDSYIIKEILGYKGRHYQQGKEILDLIKKSLEDLEDND